jgi:N-acetylmuramic acid 6-phosphate etherase
MDRPGPDGAHTLLRKGGSAPSTEDVDPRFVDLDSWPLATAVEAMWEGQVSAVAAMRPALPALAAAAAGAAAVLGDVGRLVYVGAGTSGRIAAQDGAELSPTFGWPQERLVFAIAGGPAALLKSVEGAEDDADEGARQVDAAEVGPSDVVLALAASGRTPFTVAALSRAAARGAATIGIANNAGTPLLSVAQHPILIETGPEPVAGSTRMKAGTTQKIALNLVSTGIMLRLGRVCRGMMVHMQATNDKLKLRAERMVARLADCDAATAARALEAAAGDIRIAALIASGAEARAARTHLSRRGGNLRMALRDVGEQPAPQPTRHRASATKR